MSRLRFRLPGRSQPLGAWMATLLPDLDRSSRRAWLDGGQVRVDGRVWDRAVRACPAGAFVEIDSCEGAGLGALAPLDDVRADLWIALVDDVPWERGRMEVDAVATLTFRILERHGGLACLELRGATVDGRAVRQGLVRLGLPVVGDLEGGGLGAPGGVRLVARSRAGESIEVLRTALEWPEEPAWPAEHDVGGSGGAEAGGEDGTLRVSDETARALEGGHPWILPDVASDPATRHRRGALVRVARRDGSSIGWAHVEAAPGLSARIWSDAADPRAAASVEARVARALSKRRRLLAAGDGTNAFRLIHAEGDDLPGVYVDRLGSLLRVLATGWASEGHRARTIDALLAQLPLTAEGQRWSVLEVLHLRSSAGAAVERVRWRDGGLDRLEENGEERVEDGIIVSERGLRFAVDPGWHAPHRPRPGFGLFLDQRENRERVAGLAREHGGRWLNLFAHTGAFSVALLAAGAEQVVSVDLSAAWLARLEANLALNAQGGVDATRHLSLRGEARRVLEGWDPGKPLRGIVIDPPTAAASGRRFWSVKDDVEPLLRAAIDHLEPGGSILVSQNRAGPPIGLDRVLERGARRAHRRIVRLERTRAGDDHPSRAGFPEGEPFEGWLATLD